MIEQIHIASRSSLASLELPQVLELVAALAATDVGRARIRGLMPVGGEELAERRATLLEMEELLADGRVVERLDEDVDALVGELRGTRPELGGPRLLRWGVVLDTAAAAISRIGEEEPGLGAITSDLADLGWLRDRIGKTLDARGDVRDDASPELARLRGRMGGLRKTAYGRLNEILRQHGDSFSEDTTPLHNGRLVLMLRAGDRGRVKGLVHGKSSTGRSLYFEPLGAVESNNDLQEAIAAEEAERRRLLRELAEALLGALEDIEPTLVVLARLDALQAAAMFGDTVNGRLVELSDGDFVLVEARHPLLTPETAPLRETVFGSRGHEGGVTPLDLELVGEQRGLVITGPNAGGKTVALKTAGLVVLLTLCGLPAPVAAGSRVPEIERLVGVIGDEQDLMLDRSTFSGRLLRLREAWEAAGPAAMILLDELGSGTDPEEGAALSIALVERLAAERALTIVTTHLVAVAAAASEGATAACASMEFDRASGLPTFRLLVGPPGSSEAIALGRQLGLPREWLERSERLVGEEHGNLQRLLADVEALRGDLEGQRQEIELLRGEAAVERQGVAAERRRLEEERRRVRSRTRKEIDAFRQRVRARMDEEIARVREDGAEASRRDAAPRAVERLFETAPVVEAEDETLAEVCVGDRVRHTEYTWSGTIEKIESDRAVVMVNGKRMQCGLKMLRPTQTDAPRRSPVVEVSRTDEMVPGELDLIGQRVEEALQHLDRYLDRALLVPHTEVRVVHGHGSGRLRRAVRGFLADHDAVSSSRPGHENEGGDGATVVRLDS